MNADSDNLLDDAPLLAAWQSFRTSGVTPFTCPGHKRAAGRFSGVLGDLLDSDVPLYGGLDSIKRARALLAETEERAAALWGGDWCRFSTGGSTHANQVLTLAVARPGDEVLVSRASHRSTLSGLVFAGLRPIWLPTEVDERFGIPVGVSERALRSALAAHPNTRAVFLVEPGYLGAGSDVDTLASVAHDAGCVVVVDQAWGGHFGFHPDYPPHALERGADAMVTSVHKALPGYSQASLVVARTSRLDADRLDRAFEAANTTSPAGSILASVDAARSLLESRGKELLSELQSNVDSARERLRRLAGVLVPGPDDLPPGRFDPAKLVVALAGAGASGNDVERALLRAGVPVEMADRDFVVPLVTLADTEATVSRLVDVLAAAITEHSGPPRTQRVAAAWDPSTSDTVAVMTPREAFFAEHTTVAADDAVGRVCAELIAPYPPGIPVLVPGEVITADVLAVLREAQANGTRIAYAADPTLATLQTVVG